MSNLKQQQIVVPPKTTKSAAGKRVQKKELPISPKSGTLLEKWRSEKTEDGHSLFEDYNEDEVAYIAKSKMLCELYENVYSSNLRLRYRLNAVAKEIRKLKKIKRFLCRRLLTYNDNIRGTHLEIPDNETNAVMDQIIGTVVNTAQSSASTSATTKAIKAASTRVPETPSRPRKRRIEAKKKDPKSDDDNVEEDKVRRHIMSIIDNVIADQQSDSLTSAPQPKKQKQNALTSPSKANNLPSTQISPNVQRPGLVTFTTSAHSVDNPSDGGKVSVAGPSRLQTSPEQNLPSHFAQPLRLYRPKNSTVTTIVAPSFCSTDKSLSSTAEKQLQYLSSPNVLQYRSDEFGHSGGTTVRGIDDIRPAAAYSPTTTLRDVLKSIAQSRKDEAAKISSQK